MTKQPIPLINIPSKTDVKICCIDGGHGLIQKLQVMSIRIGQRITMASKQPFRGPVTIKVNGREITLGRGMAKKILVEVIE